MSTEQGLFSTYSVNATRRWPMPRLPRYVLPGHPHHIIQRGNNRCPIFVSDEDYGCFKHSLSEACERHDCQIHAYVLMTNHVHLLMTPQKENSLAKVLQSVGRRYVQYFNIVYQRTGTLWEGRYKATVIDTERYLLTCYRYIELNPVRANMVAHPGEYRWSSYAANALGKSDPLVTPHVLYQALGARTHQRQAAYRNLFQAHIDRKTLEAIRQATQKGWALGNDRFKDEIEQFLNRRTRPLPRGGDRRSIAFRESKVRL
jgi:REP-associated tyrosine transposase